VRKTEVPNNTPEQVRLYLEAALELVVALETPADLRESCFTEAVRLLSGKQILLEQPQAIGGLPAGLELGLGRH
jgi:hypothetical protein